jgi:hypothetical protein
MAEALQQGLWGWVVAAALLGAVSCGGVTQHGSMTEAQGGSAATEAGPPIPVTEVWPSPGCNQPLPAAQLLQQYSQYSTHVTGHTLDPSFAVPAHDRNYYVWLPADYDNTKPYRVTFLFMGCGDRNAASTATYKLMSKDPESIYVAMNMPPEGLPPAGKDCYDVTVGKQSVEWEFMALTASAVQRDFCIDENQLFVAGYSSGAWVANMFGCYFAGRDPSRLFGKDISVRGQASVTGGPVLPEVPCGGKVAALWIHDTDDHENLIAGNREVSLPRVLAVNGCSAGAAGPVAPWGSTPFLNLVCQQYTACPSDYPVVFCATQGKAQSAEDDLAIVGFIEFEDLIKPH